MPVSEWGPFFDKREALSTRAAARLRAACDANPGAWKAEHLKLMTDACEAAGVELGAFDLAPFRQLAMYEPFNAVVMAAVIDRVFKAGQAAGPDGGEPLTASPEVRCAGVDDDPDDDGAGALDCGDLSRFVIWRSDGDASYGINGGCEEACERHLAGAVRAPGGNETWHDWDLRTERFLRSLLPEPDAAP